MMAITFVVCAIYFWLAMNFAGHPILGAIGALFYGIVAIILPYFLMQ